MRRMDTLCTRCLRTSASSPPVCLPKALPIIFTCATDSAPQPPNVSNGIDLKMMPAPLQASPCLAIFLSCAFTRACPGVTAACCTIATWRGLTTVMSRVCSLEELEDDLRIAEPLSNHEHILKLCKDKRTIPPININDSTDLLNKMKKNVNDIYSITALNYKNAGSEGLAHFNFLLNAIISDVNNATLEELTWCLDWSCIKGIIS